MRRFLLDHYSGLDSPVHRLPAAVKLGAAIALVIIIAMLPVHHAWYLLWPAMALVVVALLSRIPVRFLARRLLLLEPFVLGVAVLAVFQPGGWRIMLALAAKCTLCLLTMILLSGTTPFSEMLRVLRKMHVPGLMVTTLALMHRYLFVLGDEAHRMKRARTSRTFVQKPAKRWRTLATVISQLFIRASERAERVYAAMCGQGVAMTPCPLYAPRGRSNQSGASVLAGLPEAHSVWCARPARTLALLAEPAPVKPFQISAGGWR